MTAIERALTYHLESDPGIAAIVGNRVFPKAGSQGADLPLLTYERVGGTHVHHLRGGSGLANATFQLNCVGVRYSDTVALREAIRNALDTYLGSMGPEGEQVEVKSCLQIGSRDDYTSASDGGAVGVFEQQVDYQIWFVEAVPTG